MPRQVKSTDQIPDVLQRVGKVGRLFTRWTDERLAHYGFSVAQLPVLFALKDGQSMTQRDLARLAQIEQPTMAQLLARMERDGLIRREPNPQDSRSSLVSLTHRALSNALRSRPLLLEASNVALEGFSAAEVEKLDDLLERMLKNLAAAVSPQT